MASRPRNVDLGPMYLQVGEDAGPQGTMPAPQADAADVDRFEAILRRGRGHERQSQETQELAVPSISEAQLQPFADADDVCDEVAHLWIGTGLRSAREVRVGLRDSLLPDTSVRLYEAGGCLRIEFACGTDRAADWLQRKLPALARSLGERLSRGLELAVHRGDGSLGGKRRWPEDAS